MKEKFIFTIVSLCMLITVLCSCKAENELLQNDENYVIDPNKITDIVYEKKAANTSEYAVIS